jgi:adenosyl cobinamide kinase/adenosyl cobinamide phosphate guanylyltransferase
MSAMNRVAPNDRPCIELLDEAVVAVLRQKTPAERVAMIFAADRTMRLRLEGHLRTRHPDWDTPAVAAEIARRMSLGTG